MTNDFEKELRERFLILDGACGTMLQKAGIRSTTGVSDSLNVEHPEVILDLHRKYIAAGADIIETNTFNNLGRETNLAGANLARKAADEAGRRIWVTGSMGPTSKMLSLSSDAGHPAARPATFFEQAEAYSGQVEALLEGGVDLFLVETVFDPINAKAALYAIDKVCGEKGVKLPVMVSATTNDRSGRLLTGQSIEALYHTVESYGIASFGLNCSFGAKDLEPVITAVAPQVNCAISVYPNAGLPNENGEYEETPEMTAAAVRSMAEKGLINIAGGCCGTTPEHIAAIKAALSGIAPRKWGGSPASSANAPLVVTGLDKVVIDLKQSNFVNVGERTNVAGSKKFARLISERNYEEAAAIARKQIEDGASIIDINMDDPMLDSKAEMEYFVRYIENDPDIARAALMIDSSDWDTIVAGISNAQGRCIVNSISLKEGEDEFLRKAAEIRRLGAAVIVMAFDEQGQATCYDRKIEICGRAYRLLTEKAHYRPQDIIFDVNILTVGTGFAEHADYAVDFIKAVRWIKENLPGCHTSGGVSNLSFAFRGNNPVREAMHSAFLYHAIEAGLDMAIVNPGMLQIYDQIEPDLLKAVEDVILNSDPQATERLVELAASLKENAADTGIQEAKQAQWRELPLEERIRHAMTKGISDYLETDLRKAMESLSPISIIEGPLLEGMEQVGRLFGEGKMFLPQVIKSAKVMRDAVALLEPHMGQNGAESGQKRRKVVLATAKGDVHDIGKNILGTVLSCNNLEVIDLGVMVDNAVIMDAVRREKPDYVGISGLITPSLAHMEDFCRLMEQEGLNIPVLVGGATTSELHTAVKLAPLYSGCVIHTSSASDCASTLNRHSLNPQECEAAVKAAQQRLRELHASRNESYVSLEEARAKAPEYDLKSYIQPEGFGEKDIFEQFLPIERITKYIDWRMFLAFWGIKDGNAGSEADRTYEDGQTELARMIINRSVEVSVKAVFNDAYSEDETIVFPEKGVRLETGRSTSTLTEFGSLADFVPAADSGITSRVGVFVVKVRDMAPHCSDCKEYAHLLREALCARLAEAAAQWLSEEAACGGPLIRPAFGYSSCPDHKLKRTAFDMLDAGKMGLSLTESCAIIPTTSICGMLISHPQASYINIRTDEGH